MSLEDLEQTNRDMSKLVDDYNANMNTLWEKKKRRGFWFGLVFIILMGLLLITTGIDLWNN